MTQSIIAIFLALTCATTLVLAAKSVAADAGAPVRHLVGDATVWAIADSMGERDLGIFKDLGQDLIQRYTPMGKTPSAIMVFAIKTGDHTILVDTGLGNPSGDRASRLMPGLAAIGIKPGDVDTVLITHMHGDHIGGLLWEGKKAFPNATVVVGRIELDFWLSDASREKFPTRKANFDQSQQIMGMYADATRTIEFGEEALPGILALDAVGHTPGQTAFLLESKGEKLLIVGDLLHAAALQFPRPDINASYDMIPAEATAARVRILDQAAAEKLTIAGMHLPFPGMGTVKKAEGGGFAFTPLAGK